jgi:site-specific DNA recombinase
MKSAYIYVRVSTDEQKRKGYSLAEQEERLLKHCEINNIKVKGIFREDFSAKNFNRPEWKKLINAIKRKKRLSPEIILFLKWDRFSRSIEYAYQMIGILRNLNAQAMAIDQPIDFEVPESIVMLAVYLSIPEAENTRRGLNTSDGTRRARKMGRWPGRAPMGYVNLTTSDGEKFIAPKQPEANHIIWSFEQLAKGTFTVNQVRKMTDIRGFKCGRSYFWKLIRNPVYCGIVTISANKNEELQFVKGVHEPLISEDLFYEVQRILKRTPREKGSKENLKAVFPLRGFLICPLCQCKLTASISRGRHSKYRYYHCVKDRCKGRFRAEVLNKSYEDELEKIRLKPEVYELFNLVLEDENIFTKRKAYLNDRTAILYEISTQQLLMSKARKFLLNEKIDFDDFSKLKKEHNKISTYLNSQLNNITTKLIDSNRNDVWSPLYSNIFQSYNNQDIEGKRDIISLFNPSAINPFTVRFESLKINEALSVVIDYYGS